MDRALRMRPWWVLRVTCRMRGHKVRTNVDRENGGRVEWCERCGEFWR